MELRSFLLVLRCLPPFKVMLAGVYLLALAGAAIYLLLSTK